MKKQGNIQKFLHKIPRTKSAVEGATEIATDIHSSFMNNADATSASDKSTVPPADLTDAASSLPDCWNTMQYKNFPKKHDGLIARHKKLGWYHCAKCDSMSIKGIRVSAKLAICSVEASGKTTTIMQASLRKK